MIGLPSTKIIVAVSLLLVSLLAVAGTAYYLTANQQDIRNKASTIDAITLTKGDYLFIDDYLLDSSVGVSRVVSKPDKSWCFKDAKYIDFRLKGGKCRPVIDSSDNFRNNQPFASVIFDESHNPEFRVWYNATTTQTEYAQKEEDYYFGSSSAYTESKDGIHWSSPYRRLDLDQTTVSGILDEGSEFSLQDERFKQVYNLVLKPEYKQIGEDWMRSKIAFSKDGLNWTEYKDLETILPGYGRSITSNKGEIFSPFINSDKDQYGVFVKIYDKYSWSGVTGDYTFPVRRVGLLTSSDFKSWMNPITGEAGEPMEVFSPGKEDYGITEFYGGPSGVKEYNGLFLGYLKILRDDLSVTGVTSSDFEDIDDEAKGGTGVGYTVLAWSRDGINWERDKVGDSYILPEVRTINGKKRYFMNTEKLASDNNVFLSPDPSDGTWDHAFAWADSSVVVGDEVYIYYGGYKTGHNIKPQTERQIGLAKLKKDRFVARKATSGTLVTKPVLLTGQLSINANTKIDDTVPGEIAIEILDASTRDRVAICKPISGVDSVSINLDCDVGFDAMVNKPVVLRFNINNAELYALNVADGFGKAEVKNDRHGGDDRVNDNVDINIYLDQLQEGTFDAKVEFFDEVDNKLYEEDVEFIDGKASIEMVDISEVDYMIVTIVGYVPVKIDMSNKKSGSRDEVDIRYEGDLLAGDLVGNDGSIGIEDISMASTYFREKNDEKDLTGDGKFDIKDLTAVFNGYRDFNKSEE